VSSDTEIFVVWGSGAWTRVDVINTAPPSTLTTRLAALVCRVRGHVDRWGATHDDETRARLDVRQCHRCGRVTITPTPPPATEDRPV
jgi:hypothetical protein